MLHIRFRPRLYITNAYNVLLWTKIKQKNLQICVYQAPSCVHFCKKKHTQEGMFFQNHNYQGGTGKYTRLRYQTTNSSSQHMMDREATQVPYTTSIVFLADSYIFCSNFPAILALFLQLAILLYEGSTFEQKLYVASYICDWIYENRPYRHKK